MLTGSGRDLEAFEANSAKLRDLRLGGRIADTPDRLVALVLRGDTAGVEAMLGRLEQRTQSQPVLWRVVAMWLGDFESAERGARALARPDNPREARIKGLQDVARLLAARGRWAEAETQLDRLREVDPAAGRTERAVLATLPLLDVPPSALDACRAELLEWEPAPPAPGAHLDQAFEAHRRAFYLGLVHSKRGEPEAALAEAERLEALPDVSGIPAVARALAATVRADVAWRQGRPPEEVLALLEPVRGNVPAFLWWEPMVGQEHARLLRSLALLQADRHEEALRWLEHGFENSPGWDYYKAPVRYLRAVAYDALSRPEEATAAREEFERLWGDADDPLSLPAGFR